MAENFDWSFEFGSCVFAEPFVSSLLPSPTVLHALLPNWWYLPSFAVTVFLLLIFSPPKPCSSCYILQPKDTISSFLLLLPLMEPQSNTIRVLFSPSLVVLCDLQPPSRVLFLLFLILLKCVWVYLVTPGFSPLIPVLCIKFVLIISLAH